MHPLSLISTALATFLIVACGRETPPVAQPLPIPSATIAPALPTPSALLEWSGRWNGVEGTYLQILAMPDAKYQIVIKNLDGERSFEGTGSTDHIYFERDGTQEKIIATNGAATGMKWLAEKKRCLTVRYGEGYCRE